VIGFRRRDSWTRRHNGSVRLSVLDGHVRQRVHQQLHPDRQSAEAAVAGAVPEAGATAAAVPHAEGVAGEP
jgi:hypothetical protein